MATKVLEKNYILSLSCKDKSGIVANVSNYLLDIGGFIIEASQFGDDSTDKFFFRAEFTAPIEKNEFNNGFKEFSEKYNMNYQLFEKDKKPKIIIAVSRESHCLNHLLHKYETGSLNAEIVGVVSNHDNLRNFTERSGIDFYHLPIKNKNKQEQEKQMLNLFKELNAELLVLARYMQVLSDDLCQNLQGKAINIHHSFLPSFKGANPYRQAFEKGVKIIGATAHFVTADLDEGPIIEQEVERVDHSFKPANLKAIGQDIENRVLFNAVKWHLEHRVILNNHKTVIFK